MTKTPGGTANHQGRTLEQTIVPVLAHHGFEVVRHSAWKKKENAYGTELLLKHVPYTTIYDQQGYTEFLLKSHRLGLEIRIECKWQQSSGSVDEKFPYLYLNCIEAMPEEDIIIIVDGGGAKPGAIRWLKEAVHQEKYVLPGRPKKNVQVFSIGEFIQWANRTLA